MEEILSRLHRSELFCDLPEAVLRADILPQGILREAVRGQYLITPQTAADHFAVVLEGRIQLLHLFADGGYDLFGVLQPGGTLGADLICTRTRLSPYYAMAAAPAQLLFFPAELILRPGRLEEVHRLAVLDRLLLTLSNANLKREYRLAILSRKGLRDRILTYLTMQAGKRGTDRFAIPFSREELASYLCVNRSALSHELSRMEQEGLISFRKNVFVLHGFSGEERMQ